MPTSIFSDEWRECLIAHYTHVLRANDQRTERTLRGVMLDVGFTEDDLRHIYVAATAHVDDVPADFTPDAQFIASVALAQAASAVLTEAPVVAEAAEPLIDDSSMDDVPFDPSFDDTDSQELLAYDESEILDESEIEDEAPALPADQLDDDDPPADPDITQLSLF